MCLLVLNVHKLIFFSILEPCFMMINFKIIILKMVNSESEAEILSYLVLLKSSMNATGKQNKQEQCKGRCV